MSDVVSTPESQAEEPAAKEAKAARGKGILDVTTMTVAMLSADGRTTTVYPAADLPPVSRSYLELVGLRAIVREGGQASYDRLMTGEPMVRKPRVEKGPRAPKPPGRELKAIALAERDRIVSVWKSEGNKVNQEAKDSAFEMALKFARELTVEQRNKAVKTRAVMHHLADLAGVPGNLHDALALSTGDIVIAELTEADAAELAAD